VHKITSAVSDGGHTLVKGPPTDVRKRVVAVVESGEHARVGRSGRRTAKILTPIGNHTGAQ
jgi:hypothetical protein